MRGSRLDARLPISRIRSASSRTARFSAKIDAPTHERVKNCAGRTAASERRLRISPFNDSDGCLESATNSRRWLGMSARHGHNSNWRSPESRSGNGHADATNQRRIRTQLTRGSPHTSNPGTTRLLRTRYQGGTPPPPKNGRAARALITSYFNVGSGRPRYFPGHHRRCCVAVVGPSFHVFGSAVGGCPIGCSGCADVGMTL
jgi:hypothetical protein